MSEDVTKSQQTVYMEDVQVSEMDSRYTNSLHSPTAIKEASKRRNLALADLEAVVVSQTHKLCTLFDGKAQTIMTSENHLRTYLTSMVPRGKDHIPFNDVNGKFIGNIIQEDATATILSARGLHGQYTTVCEKTRFEEGISKKESDWSNESLKLHKILRDQGEKAKGEVSHCLDGKGEIEEKRSTGEASMENYDLWSRFAVTSYEQALKHGRDTGPGWAVTAKRARKAVRGMLREIPEGSL